MEEVDFSPKECEIAMAMGDVKNSIDLTMGKLAQEIGISIHNQKYYNVIKTLCNLQIIELKDKPGNQKMVKIYHKRLKKLIWRVPYFNKFRGYIEKHCFLIAR